MKQLNDRGIKTILTMGNHDDRENFRQVFKMKSVEGPIFYREECGELQIIVLDTLNTRFQSPRERIGCFEGEQLDWLSKVFEGDPEKPTIIAFHHPVYPPPHNAFRGKLFDQSQQDEFHKVISKGNVLAVLYGHLHYNQVANVNGVLHVQAGSTFTELNFNEEEYWLSNTSSYNQIIYNNETVYVKTISMPSDGRELARGLIQNLLP